MRVKVDDAQHQEEFLLNTNNKELYIPPLVWGIQHNYSRDAMLLFFASDYYDPDDYIRDYDKFFIHYFYARIKFPETIKNIPMYVVKI